MRRAVLDLLGQAGLPGRWSWNRIAIVHNNGPLIPSRQVEGDYSWNRGFNLILYSEAGTPAYFCKCRPAHHAPFRREMETMRMLSSMPALREVVPATLVASNDVLLLQVSEYLPGRPLAVSLPGLSTSAWHEVMARVLAKVELVSQVAEGALPWLQPQERVNVAAEAEPALAYLSGLMGRELDLEAFRAALASAGEVLSRPQHGDLWPGNVVVSNRALLLLDFEQFGTIRVPYYDVLHFVRTSWDLRRPTVEGARGKSWLARLQLEEGPAGATTALLRQRLSSEGLAPVQGAGLVTYYVLDIAYRYHRRGLYYTRFLSEVRSLSQHLAAGSLPLAFG